VTANGVLANVYGSQFVANNVPLQEGANTITVVAKDTANNMATASVTVNAVKTGSYIKLSSNIDSSIAPLTANFSASTSFIPVSYQMDFEGDGVVDYTGTTFKDIAHAYTAEGIFYPTVTVTDNQGNAYSDTIAITVLSKAEIDALLKSKWEGMKGELAQNNINSAVSYFAAETKQLYSDIFTALYSQLPQLAQNMQDIQLIYAKNNTAKYRLKKNELYGGSVKTITYYIYFVIDKDGIWKIYRY
jgi:PKD repeat protein